MYVVIVNEENERNEFEFKTFNEQSAFLTALWRFGNGKISWYCSWKGHKQ